MNDIIDFSIEPYINKPKNRHNYIVHGSVLTYNKTTYIHSETNVPVKITHKCLTTTKLCTNLLYIVSYFPIEMIITALPNVIIRNKRVLLQTFDSFVTVETSKEFYKQYLSTAYDKINTNTN